MIIREIQASDLDWLRSVPKQTSLPSLRNVVIDGILDKNGPIGYGMTRLFAEALIVIEPSLSNLEKARAIKILYEACIAACDETDELHAFVKDSLFAKLLEKHFGFWQVPGIHMMKRL